MDMKKLSTFIKQNKINLTYIHYLINTSSETASGHFPYNQSVAVDVRHDVGLEVVLIQSLVQDFWSHVASGPHTCAQWDVHFICVTETKKNLLPHND